MIAGKLRLPFGTGAGLQFICVRWLQDGSMIHPISQITFYILFLKEKNNYAEWNRC